MPLFGSKDTHSTDQDRQLEKSIAKEARSDQKTLDHAVKDLKNAESSHNKGIKAADKAQRAMEQAAKHEHKAADALNKAHHQHEAALSDRSSAEKTLELKQQHEQRLQQSLEQRKQAMENTQQRKQANDQRREANLSDLHAQAARALDAGGGGQLHSNGHANDNAPAAQAVPADAPPTDAGVGLGIAPDDNNQV